MCVRDFFCCNLFSREAGSIFIENITFGGKDVFVELEELKNSFKS